MNDEQSWKLKKYMQRIRHLQDAIDTEVLNNEDHVYAIQSSIELWHEKVERYIDEIMEEELRREE